MRRTRIAAGWRFQHETNKFGIERSWTPILEYIFWYFEKVFGQLYASCSRNNGILKIFADNLLLPSSRKNLISIFFLPNQVFSVVGLRCALFFRECVAPYKRPCRHLRHPSSIRLPRFIDGNVQGYWWYSRNIDNMAEIHLVPYLRYDFHVLLDRNVMVQNIGHWCYACFAWLRSNYSCRYCLWMCTCVWWSFYWQFENQSGLQLHWIYRYVSGILKRRL